ncbi:MAG: hypothetical protein ACLFN8_00705 [Candidatus Woesearchaeota archaeon]
MKSLKLSLFLISMLFLATATSAFVAVSGFDPTYEGNFSDSANQPTVMTHERGFIHVVNIDKSQQTPRWKAYVGNITGELALGDGTYSIFNWNLTTITGEIYATRYNGTFASSPPNLSEEWPQGDSSNTLPIWSTMECATQDEINNETTLLNHNYDLDVDALNRTFTTGFTFQNFAVASRTIDTSTCRGTFLNYNATNDNSEQGVAGWQQVVLTDRGDGISSGADYAPDLMYAALLKDSGLGFNGEVYDYQILLPENGDLSEQNPDPIPYYFYMELLGSVN